MICQLGLCPFNLHGYSSLQQEAGALSLLSVLHGSHKQWWVNCHLSTTLAIPATWRIDRDDNVHCDDAWRWSWNILSIFLDFCIECIDTACKKKVPYVMPKNCVHTLLSSISQLILFLMFKASCTKSVFSLKFLLSGIINILIKGVVASNYTLLVSNFFYCSKKCGTRSD